MAEALSLPIGAYTAKPVACLPHDDGAFAVAREVRALIRARCPEARVEHIGSTAVPGCWGKGIIDLVVLYEEGGLEATRNALDALGFQRQRQGILFPESRPMRVGSYSLGGRTYLLHAHVVWAGSAEALTLLEFRDALRADPALAQRYMETKRRIVAEGVASARHYTERKSMFIEQEIERLGSAP